VLVERVLRGGITGVLARVVPEERPEEELLLLTGAAFFTGLLVLAAAGLGAGVFRVGKIKLRDQR
jgi:hypothetical protein